MNCIKCGEELCRPIDDYTHSIHHHCKNDSKEKTTEQYLTDLITMKLPDKTQDYFLGYIDGFAKGIRFAFTLLRKESD